MRIARSLPHDPRPDGHRRSVRRPGRAGGRDVRARHRDQGDQGRLRLHGSTCPACQMSEIDISVMGNRLTRERQARGGGAPRGRSLLRLRAQLRHLQPLVRAAGRGRRRQDQGRAQDGVLHIVVPKRAEMQARNVEIGGKEAAQGDRRPGRRPSRAEDRGGGQEGGVALTRRASLARRRWRPAARSSISARMKSVCVFCGGNPGVTGRATGRRRRASAGCSPPAASPWSTAAPPRA